MKPIAVYVVQEKEHDEQETVTYDAIWIDTVVVGVDVMAVVITTIGNINVVSINNITVKDPLTIGGR